MLGLRPFTHSTSPETCAFDGRPPQLDGRVVTFELRRAARGDALAVRLAARDDAPLLPPSTDDGDALAVLHAGRMEEPPRDAGAFVNFANRQFGYGRFIPSATQEEILQSACPEFNVGMTVLAAMRDEEVAVVRGARRFVDYRGYLGSFEVRHS